MENQPISKNWRARFEKLYAENQGIFYLLGILIGILFFIIPALLPTLTISLYLNKFFNMENYLLSLAVLFVGLFAFARFTDKRINKINEALKKHEDLAKTTAKNHEDLVKTTAKNHEDLAKTTAQSNEDLAKETYKMFLHLKLHHVIFDRVIRYKENINEIRMSTIKDKITPYELKMLEVSEKEIEKNNEFFQNYPFFIYFNKEDAIRKFEEEFNSKNPPIKK
jgi:hypothetical protein